MNRVVLLFCHGGSYNKESWKPIIKRLQKSPLLQRVPCEIAAFDWRFHGDKSDHSVRATLSYLDVAETHPQVDHPLRVWTQWGPGDLLDEIKNIKSSGSTNTTRIVGIGHSMGAAALLNVEINNPGTFDGIVAFEPVNDDGQTPQKMALQVNSMLMAVCMNRQGEWNSWEDVITHFKSDKMFRRWHPECIDAFLETGVRQMADGKFRLATHPHQEAAIYCHQPMKLDFERIQCPVTFEIAEKSYFFNANAVREVASKMPQKFSVGTPIAKTSHMMVLEDPDTCAAHILSSLEKLPVFQPNAKL